MKNHHVKLGIGTLVVLLTVSAVYGVLRYKQTPENTQSRHLQETEQFTLSEYQKNQKKLRRKYPAFSFWGEPNKDDQVSDEVAVEILNEVLEREREKRRRLGKPPKSRDELLSDINDRLQRWSDPNAYEDLLRRSDEIIKRSKENISRVEQPLSVMKSDIEGLKQQVMKLITEKRELIGILDQQSAALDTMGTTLEDLGDFRRQFPSDPPPSENTDGIVETGPPVEGPSPDRFQSEILKESILNAFSDEDWFKNFTSQLSDWNADFDDQYLDVIVAPYLSQEEFEAFFPTDASRAELKIRQQEMQSEIAARVEKFLEGNPGSRSEKLTIIRQTLSANWSPDIAESVLEQLSLE